MIMEILIAAAGMIAGKLGLEGIKYVNRKWLKLGFLPMTGADTNEREEPLPEPWIRDQTYEEGYIVSHNYNYYVCLKKHNTAISNITPGRNSNVWAVLNVNVQ
jgi:hypothetical protein